jgi:hypothetical protein
MPASLESLWDDDNFTVQAGIIPGQVTLSGADLGTGIIYYPVQISLIHRFGGNVTSSRATSSDLSFLWNTGFESQIFNPSEKSSRFIRVALKPSPQLAAELPQEFGGLVSAALLEDDWAKPFKDSVQEDLDAIGAFIAPLRSGETPDPESRRRAILAKQDLDLKLLWSAGEYRRRGIFKMGYRSINLAATTPATGLVNVTVHTKDGANTAVSGCVVWYVSRINHGKPGLYKSFSQFSTPTSEHLAVGNYDMWTEKGANQGSKRAISIVSASTSQTVDLLAP